MFKSWKASAEKWKNGIIKGAVPFYKGAVPFYPYTTQDAFAQLFSSAYPGGGKLLKFEAADVNDFEKPMKTTIQLHINHFLRETEKKFTFYLDGGAMLGFKDMIGGEYRKYAVWLPYAFSAKSEYIIEVPQDYAVTFMPEDIALDLPFAAYSCSFKAERRKIYVNISTIVKTRIIPVGKFGQFKNMIEKIFKHNFQEVMLSEKKQE